MVSAFILVAFWGTLGQRSTIIAITLAPEMDLSLGELCRKPDTLVRNHIEI